MERPIETIPIRLVFADGSVQIMQIVMDDGRGIKRFTLTQDDIITEIHRAFGPGARPVSHAVMAWADLPTDRTYRDAWTVVDDQIGYDMAKAREIHKDRLRTERAPKLAELDIAYLQALEAGNTKAQQDIAAQKQALRDVTDDPAIEAAAGIATLKAVRPAALDVALADVVEATKS